MDPAVQELKNEFEVNLILDLWWEAYEEWTGDMVWNHILDREHRYLRCDDLTEKEEKFLAMVKEWCQ